MEKYIIASREKILYWGEVKLVKVVDVHKFNDLNKLSPNFLIFTYLQSLYSINSKCNFYYLILINGMTIQFI